MAEYLTEDLISEILCRLPIQVLVSFKRVSKTWNYLISDVCIPRTASRLSGFVFHAGSLSNPRKHFIDYVSYKSDECAYKYNPTDASHGFVESLSGLLPSEYSPYDVLDCCNGLILLLGHGDIRYFVYNPATKQFIAIPKVVRHVQALHAALVFNPIESSCFRIVRFVYALSCSVSNPPDIDMYSSESNQWIRRVLRVDPPVVYGVPWARYSVHLDTMLYKLTLSKHLLQIDHKAFSAQAIDLPYKDKINKCGFIGVSKGVLNYANDDAGYYRILIWHFDYKKKSGSFWELKHCIHVGSLGACQPTSWNVYMRSYCSMFMPYAIHPTSDIIFIGIPNLVYSYHLKSKELKVLFTRSPEKELIWTHYCFYPLSRCNIMLNAVKSSHLPQSLKPMRNAEDINVVGASEAA